MKKKFEQPNVDSSTVAELSAKLIEANNKLHSAELERTAMLENISHDLRAPLTAIRSTVDYLNQMNENENISLSKEEVSGMLRLLDVRTRTLEVLIQDLYYLTCIESGREELKMKIIPLGQLLEEFFFSAEIDDRYAKRKLELDIPLDFDSMVSVDVDKIYRVLDNLFTNAYKYSENGATIVLGAQKEKGSALFYVKDTGFGIPEDAIEHVFDRTYKVQGARTPSSEQSSGLGLSIVKSIINQHGGRVWCESILGEGSSFFVELPIVIDGDESFD